MVLESLSSPWKAEQRPYMLILWGAVYAVLAGALALFLFPGDMSSMVMVALTAIAAVPLMYNTIKFEEAKESTSLSEKKLLMEHSKAIMVFVMLFLGMTLGMTLLYLFLPAFVSSGQVSHLFSNQIQTFKTINPGHQITGQVTGTSGDVFLKIFMNNLKVLVFCIVFSLLYGAGAMFVLSWNASVIALAIGNVIHTGLVATGAALSFGDYFHIIAIQGFSRYFIHGIFEFGAYIIAALAGGIISVAIIKKHFHGPNVEHVILDVSDLILASLVVLTFAAVIEVYITPVLFANPI